MKVVLQNCVTGRFLGNKHRWLVTDADAMTFPDTASAIHYVIRHGLPDCEAVLKFGSPEYDIQVPISKSCVEKASKG